MEFIFVILIVNVFVQSLSCEYVVNPVTISADDDDELLFVPEFEYQLTKQFLRRQTAIIHSWRECNEAFRVPFHEAIKIFLGDRWNFAQDVNKSLKCLADCTMRKTGVITDNGLDDVEYMLQIRQLRYNYTSYDINERSSETKQKMLATILDLIWTSDLSDYEVKNLDLDVFDLPLYRIPVRPSFGATSFDLIWSYLLAARKCKKLKDRGGDNCETSWMIMLCIIGENQKRFFNSPFYPVELNALRQ